MPDGPPRSARLRSLLSSPQAIASAPFKVPCGDGPADTIPALRCGAPHALSPGLSVPWGDGPAETAPLAAADSAGCVPGRPIGCPGVEPTDAFLEWEAFREWLPSVCRAEAPAPPPG